MQAQPDEALLGQLGDLQQRLAASFPLPLQLIPATALHCSVMTFIPPHRTDPDKEADWQRIKAAMPTNLEALVRDTAATPIPIRLCHLRVSPQAIIAWTPEQPPLFVEIRARFADLLRSLGLQAPTYALTHITVARYAASGAVPGDSIQRLENEPIDITAAFSGLRFARERQYPSLILNQL